MFLIVSNEKSERIVSLSFLRETRFFLKTVFCLYLFLGIFFCHGNRLRYSVGVRFVYKHTVIECQNGKHDLVITFISL